VSSIFADPVFAELLGRSSFSFLRGASQPEEMMSRAKELGLESMALCDQNGLYGSVRAFARAKEIETRLIVGAELDLAIPGAVVERSDAWRASKADPVAVDVPSVALLAENHAGYTNLCRLLTRAHAGLPKGEALLEVDALAAHDEGLVAIVPGPRLPRSSGNPPDSILEALVGAFGRERVFIAAFRRLDGLDPERMEIVDGWSERFGIDVLASARPLYHKKSRKPLADVLHCIRTGTTLDSAGLELSANGEAYLRSDIEMRKLFSDVEEWVDRAGELAEGLRFSLEQIRYDFPCELRPGETADEALRRLVEVGKRRRYPAGVPVGVEAQLEKELRLVAELRVAPYFLSTYEVVEIARARRILCQGRGSAANSAVCYVLGITAVDPARSNLLFERFLSAERHEPPDIDIDFEHERREEVIQEIYERYGRDRAAMVSEVICYRGKSAIREVGKAFGLSLEQVDRLSGMLTHWDSIDEGAKRAREMGFDLDDDRLRKVLVLARALEGFPRHLSIHVGGFVLSACPLSEVAPTEPARMVDRTVIPWDKDDIEALGFFKIDVLGLGMLTAIRKCLALLFEDGELRGNDERFDPLEVITRIPPEDRAVYDLASRGDTIGVFQIESRAQMAMLPRLRPQRFYDLVIEVAIVRPGPIQGGMVHPYLRRRNGEEAVASPHPDLWPIVERTLGVPLFQEQVMQIAIVGAGYTGGEADQLRRDMAAWKKSGKLLRHKGRLLEGFAKKGISSQFGEALFEQIKGFGDYGFPESHAASFALLVYASCWQKAHYPAHFVCAILNSQPMGFYSPSTLVRDAQKHGVEVREVSVTRSNWDSTLEAVDAPIRNPSERSEPAPRACEARGGSGGFPPGRTTAGAGGRECNKPHDEFRRSLDGGRECSKALRLGFRLVKGIGESTGRAIETARSERPFSSLDDLVRRAKLKKNEIEALAEAGALEDLVPGRRQALWKARAPRVKGLFEPLDVREPDVTLPPLPAAQQLLLDYGRKGLSVDDHPMKHLRAKLRRRRVITAADLYTRPQGERVTVAGLVLTRQRPGTASGVVFITLEDETGFCNLILYSSTFDRFYLAGRHASLLLAKGKVEREVTAVRPGEVGEATPVVHLLVEHLERLDVPGRDVESMSRDFH
jgi:error-prone DNA polymerase